VEANEHCLLPSDWPCNCLGEPSFMAASRPRSFVARLVTALDGTWFLFKRVIWSGHEVRAVGLKEPPILSKRILGGGRRYQLEAISATEADFYSPINIPIHGFNVQKASNIFTGLGFRVIAEE